MTITDNGIGFDPAQVRQTGLEMVNIGDYSDAMNATLEIESKPGHGPTSNWSSRSRSRSVWNTRQASMTRLKLALTAQVQSASNLLRHNCGAHPPCDWHNPAGSVKPSAICRTRSGL